ncbi:MAG: hypothetical protein QOI53_980, partial [Verrucomicrobiota bacterium]|nr:hypothetical protein [Verrucomicrobiota bacterium]
WSSAGRVPYWEHQSDGDVNETDEGNRSLDTEDERLAFESMKGGSADRQAIRQTVKRTDVPVLVRMRRVAALLDLQNPIPTIEKGFALALSSYRL